MIPLFDSLFNMNNRKKAMLKTLVSRKKDDQLLSKSKQSCNILQKQIFKRFS